MRIWQHKTTERTHMHRPCFVVVGCVCLLSMYASDRERERISFAEWMEEPWHTHTHSLSIGKCESNATHKPHARILAMANADMEKSRLNNRIARISIFEGKTTTSARHPNRWIRFPFCCFRRRRIDATINICYDCHGYSTGERERTSARTCLRTAMVVPLVACVRMCERLHAFRTWTKFVERMCEELRV